MKYFVLHVAFNDDDDFSNEYYIKGNSLDYVTQQIERYSNGCLSSSKFNLCTSNIQYGFLREVHLREFPNLSPKDFALISESRSYNLTDFK